MTKDEPVMRDTTRLTVGSTLAVFRAIIQGGEPWTKWCQKAYDDAQEDLRLQSLALFTAAEREKQLCHALVTLRNEVGGTLSFAGTLREAIGNTNYACLENAHGIANAALASEQQEEKP